MHKFVCFSIILQTFLRSIIADFAVFCNSCSLHRTCKCIEESPEILKVDCDGVRNLSARFPHAYLDKTNCDGREYEANGRVLEIFISNYPTDAIPANSIRTNAVKSDKTEIDFYNLQNLKTFDANALVDINAFTRLSISFCSINAIPFEALEKAHFDCSKANFSIEFIETDINQLSAGQFEKLSKSLAGCSLHKINLRNHRLQSIPFGAFTNLRIEDKLDLTGKLLKTIETAAFQNVAIGTLAINIPKEKYLAWKTDANDKLTIKTGAFQNVRVKNMQIYADPHLTVVESGAFQDVYIQSTNPQLLSNLAECVQSRSDRSWFCKRSMDSNSSIQLSTSTIEAIVADRNKDPSSVSTLEEDSRKTQTTPTRVDHPIRFPSNNDSDSSSEPDPERKLRDSEDKLDTAVAAPIQSSPSIIYFAIGGACGSIIVVAILFVAVKLTIRWQRKRRIMQRTQKFNPSYHVANSVTIIEEDGDYESIPADDYDDNDDDNGSFEDFTLGTSPNAIRSIQSETHANANEFHGTAQSAVSDLFGEAEDRMETENQSANTAALTSFIQKLKRENVKEILPNEIVKGEQLGFGCDGTVYAVYIIANVNGSEDQKFALKVANGDDVKAQLELSKEAYTISKQYQHTNLQSIAGFGQIDGGCSPKFFLVLPFAQNGSLTNYIEKTLRGWSPEACYKTLLFIAIGTTKGLAALHRKHYVHMDLRADNVLIMKDAVAKISDFARARHIPNGVYQFETDKKFRPCYWYAVEALCNREYQFASDIWSLGVVFWEMFSMGLHPYDELPQGPLLYMHLLNGGRLPIEKARLATDRIKNLMLQCWDRNPSKRPTLDKIIEIIEEEYEQVSGQSVDRHIEAEALEMARIDNV